MKVDEIMKKHEQLSAITCIDSAEGMAKRVLSDISAENFSMEELIESYQLDYLHGGKKYENIIRLGELIMKLDNSIKKD